MTNNSIFTRVLALVLGFMMIAGLMTSCFQMPEFNPEVGTPSQNVGGDKPTTPPTTGDKVENDPVEDPIDPVEPVDPNELFSGSTTLSNDALIYGALANDVFIGGEDGVTAMIPADVKVEAGASSLSLSIKKVEDETLADNLSNLDVHISGVALDNTVPMTVMLGAILPAGLGLTELKLYHVENGTPVLMTRVNSAIDFAIHNQYVYDAETGNVTIYVSSFSVFTAVQTTADVWDGEATDTSWYNENNTEFTLTTVEQFVGFRDLVDAGNTFEGKTVILATDIDLADKPFDPIGFGYYKNDKRTEVEGVVTDTNTVFLGTFDGGNHTIYNLYENCWELDPDKTNYATYTYSTAGAGLFASIKDATIKNIAISGAEVVFECVDMGVLVGYAQGECQFENIVITNANIANYNRYTGGLVGEVSYGVDNNGDGYSHTFKNITIDSTVTVSGLWGSFGCGMGGVIGGKWGDATVLMENVVSAPVMDVYNDVVSAYQWYAFRGCGMLIGHTEEPYSDGRHSGIATANFLTCENVKVYYGEWVNYTYYEFENQDNATGRNYPWVRAEAGVYCDAFSNIRYGVPTHNGVKVSDLTEEELKAVKTDYTPIIFNQLYGADRGMYGQEAHDGVTVINKNTKTIYIQNNLGWENLKLHYWYKHGDDTWTNHDTDGIVLTEENGVYKVVLPAYAFAFKITADGENVTRDFYLSEVTEPETYNLEFEHVHYFVGNKCDCGATQITTEYDFTFGANGEATHKDGSTSKTTYSETNNDLTLSITSGTNMYPNSYDAQGNSCIKLGTSSKTGSFSFTVSNDVVKVIIYVAGYKDSEANITINGTSYTAKTLSNNGEYTAFEIDTITNKTVEFTTVNKTDDRCMINTITLIVAKTIEVHNCNENIVIEGTNATCTENGLTAGAKCDVCGTVTKEQETIPATGHTPVIDEAVAPQCNATGLTEGSHCDECDEVFVAQEVLPEAKEHSFVNDECEWCGALNHEHTYTPVVTDATCTTPGYTTYTCECGDSYTDDEVAATGHTRVNYVCTVCGDDLKKTIEIISANLGVANGVDVDDTKYQEITITAGKGSNSSGNTPKYYTSGSAIRVYVGNTVTLTAPEGAIILSVTYTAVSSYTLSNATFSSGEASTSGTVTTVNGINANYLTFTNANSGNTQMRIVSISITYYIPVPCDHTNTTEEIVDPTCTEAGSIITKCTDCGTVISTETGADPTGHLHTTEETVDPTCTEAGSIITKCTDCGTVISTETGADATGHLHTTEETVDPTCTVAGSTTVTCDDCGATISTEVTEATGHSYVDGTCTSCGADDPNAGGSTTPQTITVAMNIYANKGTTGTNTISWNSGDITVTNNKASSSTAIRTSDSDHFRVYAKSQLVISTANGKISSVVITCTSSSYATAMKTSATNAGYNATVSGSVVTITVNNEESITLTASEQTRINKVEVIYTK